MDFIGIANIVRSQLVLNNFGDDSRHMKLMVSMFQNMFPAINVQTMKLSEARRVLLFSYDKETGQIEVRHYSIGVSLTGVSKSVKRIVQANIPDLHNFEDIGDFILRGSQASESDVEDGPETTVTLSQNFVGRNNRKSEQRAIRLSELGPRMTLQLVKIQEGMCDGEVLYHEFGGFISLLFSALSG
jgi:ribosome biogenesis protein SSF1/2